MNRFYRVAVDVLIEADAVIDKFVGDEVVALFIPGLAGKGHARKAIDAAAEILRATGEDGSPWLPIGVGVHTGQAYVDAVGAEGQLTDFTALGDAVNATARPASAAGAGETLASGAAVRAAELDTSGLAERGAAGAIRAHGGGVCHPRHPGTDIGGRRARRRPALSDDELPLSRSRSAVCQEGVGTVERPREGVDDGRVEPLDAGLAAEPGPLAAREGHVAGHVELDRRWHVEHIVEDGPGFAIADRGEARQRRLPALAKGARLVDEAGRELGGGACPDPLEMHGWREGEPEPEDGRQIAAWRR